MEQIFLLTSSGGTQCGDWVAVVSGIFVESPLGWTVGVLCCLGVENRDDGLAEARPL